jgi:flagellar protein FlgJ
MIAKQLENGSRSSDAQSGPTPARSMPTALPLERAPRFLPMSPASSAPAAFALSLPAADTPSGLPLPAGLRGATLQLEPSAHGVSLPAFAPRPAPAPLIDTAANAAPCADDAPLDCSSPEAFARSIWPHARKAAAELGVPARALVAQAALETGWGRRLVGDDRQADSHNLFGIKAGAGWRGAKVESATHEFVGGVRVNQRDSFRAYASPAESFADYVDLLSRERYAAARGTDGDVRGFASALQRAGYATDPRYADKIAAIADGPTLRRALAGLDAGAAPMLVADAGAAGRRF